MTLCRIACVEQSERRTRIKGRLLARTEDRLRLVDFIEGKERLPTDSQRQRQARADLPIILGVRGKRLSASFVVSHGELLHVGGLPQDK